MKELRNYLNYNDIDMAQLRSFQTVVSDIVMLAINKTGVLTQWDGKYITVTKDIAEKLDIILCLENYGIKSPEDIIGNKIFICCYGDLMDNSELDLSCADSDDELSLTEWKESHEVYFYVKEKYTLYMIETVIYEAFRVKTFMDFEDINEIVMNLKLVELNGGDLDKFFKKLERSFKKLVIS